MCASKLHLLIFVTSSNKTSHSLWNTYSVIHRLCPNSEAASSWGPCLRSPRRTAKWDGLRSISWYVTGSYCPYLLPPPSPSNQLQSQALVIISDIRQNIFKLFENCLKTVQYGVRDSSFFCVVQYVSINFPTAQQAHHLFQINGRPFPGNDTYIYYHMIIDII